MVKGGVSFRVEGGWSGCCWLELDMEGEGRLARAEPRAEAGEPWTT